MGSMGVNSPCSCLNIWVCPALKEDFHDVAELADDRVVEWALRFLVCGVDAGTGIEKDGDDSRVPVSGRVVQRCAAGLESKEEEGKE